MSYDQREMNILLLQNFQNKPADTSHSLCNKQNRAMGKGTLSYKLYFFIRMVDAKT